MREYIGPPIIAAEGVPGLRIRGRRGIRMRYAFLYAHPLCAECARQGIATPATQVDHIVALANGGTDTDDNKQALCDACHRTKTNIDLGYKPQCACDENGFPLDKSHPWNKDDDDSDE